jgi:hypothetical protein
MERIQNARPGILIVPDAGLKLSPGEVAEVHSLSKQTGRLLASGHLVRVGEAPENRLPVEETALSLFEDPAPDLSKLSAQQAIARVAEMDDPERLRECLGSEKRRSVLDMLDRKLKEVGGGAQ